MEFLDVGKLLVSIMWFSNLAHRGANVSWFRIPLREYELMKERIDFVCTELERLDLPVSLVSARELRTVILNETTIFDKELPPGTEQSIAFPTLTVKRFWSYTEELSTRIEDELSAKMVMIMPSSKTSYFDGSNNVFPVSVRNKFPSAEYDMDEGSKCYAFARYTACVFHLMRILELGLNTLGSSLGLSIAPNWNRAITDIENEIGGRSYATHPGWRDDEPFYSEAAAHFRMVKNAWRNHTMHIKEKYDEERAQDIFNSVSAFMRHLATRLHE
jgi:hypothetical protein